MDTVPVTLIYSFWLPLGRDNTLIRATIPQKALIYLKILDSKEQITNNFDYATHFLFSFPRGKGELVGIGELPSMDVLGGGIHLDSIGSIRLQVCIGVEVEPF